jgi:hypothetical protein
VVAFIVIKYTVTKTSEDFCPEINWKFIKRYCHSILSYGEEAWTETSEDMNALRIFKRKILRKTCGPIKE